MPDFALDFEPRLLEECVLLAIEGAQAADRAQFRRERNAQYELPDEDAREAGFQELGLRWFARLELQKPVLQALEEQPSVVHSTSRAFILAALAAKEEAADLHESREQARPVLVIRLRPVTLVDPAQLLPLLRHELQHVADMLEPEFGYERASPGEGAGPVYENLLRQRYRVLWDATIDGRLRARGLLDPDVEELRRREFAATFVMLGARVEEFFQRYFRGPRPRHHDLWAFAAQPMEGVSTAPAGAGTRRCPLCELPTASFHADAEGLGPAVLSRIREDFPTWTRELGLCRQCADLYASRGVQEASR